MSKHNLTEFFIATGVNITEFTSEPQILAIQILYLYHPILFWYVGDRIKKYKLYDALLNMPPINDLHEIPSELQGRYISIIEPRCQLYSYELIDCIEKVESDYKAIYMNDGNRYYIVFLFHYSRAIILIDTESLDIIEFKTLKECIEHIYTICSKNVICQMTSIAYRPSCSEYNRP